MRRNLVTAFLAVAGLLLATVGVFAHHSQSGEFDNSKPIEFTGTVKAILWTNPHGYVQVEAKDANGKTQLWRVEISAPNGLYRQGWRRDTLKPGMTVSFKGIHARDPQSDHLSGRLAVEGKPVFQGQGPAADLN